MPRRIPQGILNERLARSKFALSRHAPDAALREFVEYYWILRWDLRGQEPHEQRVLPNLSVHASFFGKASGVFGPAHESFSHLLEGEVRGLGVRFRPGCFSPFLDRPVSSLADTSIPLTEIFGAEAERTQRVVSNAVSDAEMVSAVDRLLCTNVPILPKRARHAAEIVEVIAEEPAIVRVDQLAARSGTTSRTLQRLFRDHVGVSPKWAIRVYRFNDAAQRISAAADIDYAALAAELGYTDQAHFTRDFTAMVGTPPAQYGNG
ncbi:AraC family transcriptional regulator [Amycolatopsis anabasis]|uniref:AraC family transcriptional regulator n=1 Tax=Amycolatopsis anabasis TaxID=1840409 RepID=UPI001FE70328|nr:helix-turn-helix domain-containing protein [Amycolatopsis anabasis]